MARVVYSASSMSTDSSLRCLDRGRPGRTVVGGPRHRTAHARQGLLTPPGARAEGARPGHGVPRRSCIPLDAGHSRGHGAGDRGHRRRWRVRGPGRGRSGGLRPARAARRAGDGRGHRRRPPRSSGPTPSRSSSRRPTGWCRLPPRRAGPMRGVRLAARRRCPPSGDLKSALVAEQLRRLAGIDRAVDVEEVAGRAGRTGLADPGQVRRRPHRARSGFHRHRSHDIELVERCPIATPRGEAGRRGRGPVEGGAPRRGDRLARRGPAGGVGRGRGDRGLAPPAPDGRGRPGGRRSDPCADRTGSAHSRCSASASRSAPGVFWQVHPGAADAADRVSCSRGCAPSRASGWPTSSPAPDCSPCPWPTPVGPTGRWWPSKRSRRACADAARNTAGLDPGRDRATRRDAAPVGARARPGPTWSCSTRPAQGAGQSVMRALAALDPPPRRIAYVSCDPASFARDLRVMLDAGWTIGSLRAFDLFPDDRARRAGRHAGPTRGRMRAAG